MALFDGDMSRIDLVSENLLPNYFRKSNKDFPCKLKQIVTNIAKIGGITKVPRFKT